MVFGVAGAGQPKMPGPASGPEGGPTAPQNGLVTGVDPYALMDLVPPGLDLIAVLNGPGRSSGLVGPIPDGDHTPVSAEAATISWVRGMGLLGETARSWTALAQRLGMTETEAANSLLGGPVVIGLEGMGNGGVLGVIGAADRGWLLVSTVADSTARRLRDRLGAVPRRIASGYAVYTVDTGQTGMALVRDGEAWRIVLSPVRNATLVDRTLARFRARLGGADQAAGVQPPVNTNASRARSLGVPIDDDGWSAIVSVRSGTTREQPLVVVTRGAPGALTARFAARGRFRHGAPVDLLDSIGGDALLAVAMAGEPWNGSDTILLGLGPESEPIGTPLRFPNGYAMALREPGTEGSGQLTAMINGCAATDGQFPEQTDLMMSTMIGGDEPPAHRGLFPDAVRTHILPSGRGPRAVGWASGKTRVAWCFRAGADDGSGVVSIAIGDGGADVAGNARFGREAWERVLASRDRADGSDVVTQGIARPDALIDAMGLGADPVLGLIGQIRYASWDLRQSGDVLRGEVTVRLKPVRAKLGGR